MKLVHKYENVFYGGGIEKTHLVDETKDKTKTLCGRDWQSFGGVYSHQSKLCEIHFKTDGSMFFVDCKICLKKYGKVKQ